VKSSWFWGADATICQWDTSFQLLWLCGIDKFSPCILADPYFICSEWTSSSPPPTSRLQVFRHRSTPWPSFWMRAWYSVTTNIASNIL